MKKILFVLLLIVSFFISTPNHVSSNNDLGMTVNGDFLSINIVNEEIGDVISFVNFNFGQDIYLADYLRGTVITANSSGRWNYALIQALEQNGISILTENGIDYAGRVSQTPEVKPQSPPKEDAHVMPETKTTINQNTLLYIVLITIYILCVLFLWKSLKPWESGRHHRSGKKSPSHGVTTAIIFLTICIIFFIQAIAKGMGAEGNVIWTVLWLVFTFASWKAYKWKALLPYTTYFTAACLLWFFNGMLNGGQRSFGLFIGLAGINITGLLMIAHAFFSNKSKNEATIDTHCRSKEGSDAMLPEETNIDHYSDDFREAIVNGDEYCEKSG